MPTWCNESYTPVCLCDHPLISAHAVYFVSSLLSCAPSIAAEINRNEKESHTKNNSHCATAHISAEIETYPVPSASFMPKFSARKQGCTFSSQTLIFFVYI